MYNVHLCIIRISKFKQRNSGKISHVYNAHWYFILADKFDLEKFNFYPFHIDWNKILYRLHNVLNKKISANLDQT